MSIWKVSPVTAEPETRLVDWQVMELPDGDRHLVGFALKAHEGRTTSPVTQFDIERLRAVTASGRVYELAGPPGSHPDAQYVWQCWRRINDVDRFVDVTMQVWAQHVASSASSPRDTGAQT